MNSVQLTIDITLMDKASALKNMYKKNIFLDAESIRNKLFHWTGPPVQDSKERSEFDMLF